MDCLNCDCSASTGCKFNGEGKKADRPKRKYEMKRPRGRRGPYKKPAAGPATAETPAVDVTTAAA